MASGSALPCPEMGFRGRGFKSRRPDRVATSYAVALRRITRLLPVSRRDRTIPRLRSIFFDCATRTPLMAGNADADDEYKSAPDRPLSDVIELTPHEEAVLVRAAEDFTRAAMPSRPMPPDFQKAFTRMATIMHRAWQNREMPPAVAAFVSRFGS